MVSETIKSSKFQPSFKLVNISTIFKDGARAKIVTI